MKPLKFFVLFWIAISNLFAQTQIVEDIPYTKYSVRGTFSPPTVNYSFNSDHDIGHLSVSSNLWREWVSVYKFSLEDLPSGYPIKKITINTDIIEQEYDDDCFIAQYWLAQNN